MVVSCSAFWNSQQEFPVISKNITQHLWTESLTNKPSSWKSGMRVFWNQLLKFYEWAILAVCCKLLFRIPQLREFMSENIRNCLHRHLDFEENLFGSQIVKINKCYVFTKHLQKCFGRASFEIDTNVNTVTPNSPRRPLKMMASRTNE